MKLFYTDHFDLPLPEGHFFPMSKYRLLRRRLHDEGLTARHELIEPEAALPDELLLAHTPDYVHRALTGQLTKAEMRRINFPWSAAMIERSRRSAGATIAAARCAIDDERAANLAGGMHHAFADCGEGYCVFNDVAVAARVLQRAGQIGRVLVVDCDAHQGNGTASIFRDDPTVFTFSIHSQGGFPRQKEFSDLDIALCDGADDDGYLTELARGLEQSLVASEPDMAFYIAGADPFAADRLGRLKLTKAGLLARDTLVFRALRRRRIPLAIVMGGGYARNIDDIVDIHAATIRLAADGWNSI